MSLKGIKLITFDATNTVLNFRVPPWRFYAVVARGHGFAGTEDTIRGRLLDSYKSTWKRYPNFGKSTISWFEWWTQVVKMTFEGQLPGNTNIEALATELIEEFKTSKCWDIAPAGEKLLCRLQSQNKTMGVISNFDPRLAEILMNVKLKDYFQFIVTSYEIGYSKPDKRIFKYALEQCGEPVRSSESLHIGDDLEKDYEGAKAAGWHALLVSDKVKCESLTASGHLFKNLEELSKAVDTNTLKL